MNEKCLVTGHECNVLTALRERHALRIEEDGPPDSAAAEIYTQEYEETLALVQKVYCSPDRVCGIIGFTDLIIASAAIGASEEEITKRTE